MEATIRWINVDNAISLGYPEGQYAAGVWVLEGAGDEWITDLDGIDEDDVEGAQTAAEQHLELPPVSWFQFGGEYGTAFHTYGEETQ